MKALVVWVTVPSRQEAKTISKTLLKEKRVACVSAIPEVQSTFWWKGKIDTSREVLLILKTTASRYKALEKRIRQLHSYEVPEIVALPIAAANPDYLTWIQKSVQ